MILRNANTKFYKGLYLDRGFKSIAAPESSGIYFGGSRTDSAWHFRLFWGI